MNLPLPALLDKIVASKRGEVERNKKSLPLREIQKLLPDLRPPGDFKAAISRPGAGGASVRIIAEIKKASPSKGVIREDFNPVEIARIYENNGASAISVLTEETYFQGSLNYLKAVRRVTKLPLLCKDFIIDPYQIYQARVSGADAVLLITAILEPGMLRDFINRAHDVSLASVVEVHTARELKKALKAEAEIIGINNRNLNTFKTDVQTTVKLLPFIPDGIMVISESGFHTREDLARVQQGRINAFLIGEALMREKDIAKKLRELLLSGC
ncbi:MAG: indole-3-glycerol phosphate synthase TrpC [Proteobacteria bacterium]|nr:indole-3-glycerol phosphate synthase TrpC [Pseudomonadota bacterium]